MPTPPDAVAVVLANYDKPPAVYSYEKWKLYSTWQEAMRKFTERRDAHWGAFSRLDGWKKGEYLFAIIYKTQKGWGPIDVYDLNVERLEGTRKPGIYEIPVLLQDCQGLAWTPDGSLGVSSANKVGVVKAEQIRACREQSGIKMDDSVNAVNVALRASIKIGGNTFMHGAEPVATNNIVSGRPELFAGDLPGGSICWVTESSFLVLGDDGFLYYWKAGNLEKQIPIPCRAFSYCANPMNESPADIQPQVSPTIASASTPAPDDAFSTTNRKTGVITVPINKFTSVWMLSKLNNSEEFNRDPFDLIFQWKKFSAKEGKVTLIVNWNDRSDKKIFYSIVDEDTLIEEIDNPSKYGYMSGDAPLEIPLKFQQVVIFRKENAFAALKPIKIYKGITLSYRVANWWRYSYDQNPSARFTGVKVKRP